MILDYLKKNTDQIHREVEQINLARLIVDHSISKDDYRRLLLQNYYFYHTVEEALIDQSSNLNAVIQPFLEQSKSQNLKHDLSTLGVEVDTYPGFSYAISSESAAIGALYVSEGSALGGLIIGKNLEHCSALQDIKKHYFFGGEVPIILARWKKFRSVIEVHFGEDNVDQKIALSSAIHTFELFRQIMLE